jgi:hypothetical protein
VEASSVADLPILITSLLLLLGVLASRLGGRLGLPGLLLFMRVGMLAGSDGLGSIWFDDYRLAQLAGVVTLVSRAGWEPTGGGCARCWPEGFRSPRWGCWSRQA